LTLKNVLLTLTSGVMALSLITGCGAAVDRNAADNDDGTRNVGYYTNQGRPNLVPDRDVYPNRPYMRNADVNDNANQYYQWDTRTARQIAQRVNGLKGVRDSSVLISGNTVVVGVVPENYNQNLQQLDEQVRIVTKNIVGDKHVRVVTDRNIVGRIMDVNKRITNGSAGREVQSDVRGILNDIGNIIQRPFQNNAR